VVPPKESNKNWNVPVDEAQSGKSRTVVIFVAVGVALAMAGMAAAFIVKEGTINESLESLKEATAPAGEEPVAAFAEETLRFGGEGVGAGKFKDNRVIGVDADNRIYSADYIGNRVQVFDNTGKFIRQWNTQEEYIQDMAVSRNGTVYVVERSVLSSYEGATGKFLHKTKDGTLGNVFVLPDGSVLGSSFTGDIWKFDENLNKISVHKDVMRQAGAESSVIKGFAANGLGEIYAMDMMGGNIFHFTKDLKFIDRFKTGADLFGSGIAVDAQGRIFLSAVNTVYVYTGDGEQLGSFGTYQTFGMAFDDAGNLWTASRPHILRYKVNK